MARRWPFGCVYVGLWLVRIWFALYGTGYIHPDEHMQNGEVTAGTLISGSDTTLVDNGEQGNILRFHALSTWEWHPDLPVRSVLPTFATTGLPLYILMLLLGPERLAQMAHPLLVFTVQRLVFLGLSSVLDYSVLSLVSAPAPRRLCLLLLASSYVTYTFQVRPFSNSLESVLLSLCLVLFRRILYKRTRLKVGGEGAGDQRIHLHAFKRDLHLLAALVAAGTFTRPTFAAFSLPIGCQILRLCFQVTNSPVQGMIGLLLPPSCTAMLVAFVFVAADTYYFRSDFSKPVVTPYNFVKYNLSTENLADHGLHPNWLHVGVNLPMLLGPLFVWFLWCSVYKHAKPSGYRTQKVPFETDVLRQTLVQIIVVSLSVLSVQPHQEPRFLIPLVFPIIVLAATTKLPRPGKLFWATWIAFNIVLAWVFGILHQGGVVPSLLSLHSTLKSAAGSNTHVVYWKTYMPPRHLLGVPQYDVELGKVSVTDLSGAAHNEVMAALSAPSSERVYLVTPMPMYWTLPQGISSCMTLKTRIFPHLDLDHIPESIEAGVYDGLGLGIYAVKMDCIIVGRADDAGILVT